MLPWRCQPLQPVWGGGSACRPQWTPERRRQARPGGGLGPPSSSLTDDKHACSSQKRHSAEAPNPHPAFHSGSDADLTVALPPARPPPTSIPGPVGSAQNRGLMTPGPPSTPGARPDLTLSPLLRGQATSLLSCRGAQCSPGADAVAGRSRSGALATPRPAPAPTGLPFCQPGVQRALPAVRSLPGPGGRRRQRRAAKAPPPAWAACSPVAHVD